MIAMFGAADERFGRCKGNNWRPSLRTLGMAEPWSAGEERDPRLPNPALPEPQPETEPEREASQGSDKTRWVLGALAGIALLAGIGYSAGLFSSVPPPAPAAITATAPTQQQGFSLLQTVSAADQASALQSLMMSDADKNNVAKAVQTGATRLAWLALSDSGAEDGDIVTISGAGFRQTVPLLTKQTRLAVPYTPGTPIKVFATKDGSSPGVTVAIHVGGSVFKLRTMKEGETIEIVSP
jgi:hypothetical protein